MTLLLFGASHHPVWVVRTLSIIPAEIHRRDIERTDEAMPDGFALS